MSRNTILIVDDESSIREMLKTSLQLSGFHCLEAKNAQDAHSVIVDSKPDLILLDWMMPVTSGIELARRLKRDDLTAHIPIIMLTAKSEEENKIHALDSVADDYITKPFSTKELMARINAVLRRSPTQANNEVLEFDGLKLDPISHRVSINEQAIEMGPTEYRILHFFMTHPERAYSRSQLLDQIWGGNVYIEERTIDVHIRRLRKAITGHGHENYIQTVRGAGYRFSNTLT